MRTALAPIVATLAAVVTLAGCAHNPPTTAEVCSGLRHARALADADIAAQNALCPTLEGKHRERCEVVLEAMNAIAIGLDAAVSSRCGGDPA